jgi:hypothetical protein
MPEKGEQIWVAGQATVSAVRPDFLQFAAAESNGVVSLRSMETGKADGPTLPHEQRMTAIAYSPDGTVLATGSRDQTARLWSVATGKQIGEAMRHQGAVVRVVFSPDGQRLATATDTGSVRLWDVATAQPLSVVLPHPRITDVFFTADGRRLVVAAFQGSIYFHDVPPLPQPAPAWLADLAEAVAQRRVDDAGETSRAGAPDLLKLRTSRATTAGEDDYARWVRWFFADRATRTASAFSDVPMSTAIDQLIAIGSLAEIEEARRRRPTAPKLMTLLAKAYRQKSEPAATAHADFLDALAAWNTTSGTAARILETQQQMRAAAAVPEAPRGPMRPLDLTAHFNNKLEVSLVKDRSPWNLAALLPGLREFDDVLFDIGGIIVAQGTTASAERPKQVAGIAVRQKARVLHMLQSATFAHANGTQIGGYVLHYADGEQRKLPLVVGEDVRDWSATDHPGLLAANATEAWSGPGGTDGLRLDHRAYENPRPDVEITSIDFVSAGTKATPFVVAITLE